MPTLKSSPQKQLSKPQNSLDRTTEGRIPPQANDIEEAVLGAILLEKEAFSDISTVLDPESFYVNAHQTIFATMRDLCLEEQPIDIHTVSQRLLREGKLEQVGGMPFLVQLSNRVISAGNLEYHAMIVAQKALSRNLIKFSTDVLTVAYEDTVDIEDQMEEAEGALFALSQRHLRKDVQPINSILKSAIDDIKSAANSAEGISGISSGFGGIDAMTAGWQKSDLIIIAARPAIGKTAFVLSMAKYMAVDSNIPVALFNLEMSSVQLVKRLISNVCELSGEKLKNGQLEQFEWAQLDERISVLEHAPLFIDDTPSLSVFELRTKARRLVREHDIKVLIIDYLQLMNASGMNFGNREQEVSTISRSLKMLAKELDIPIIALSQLNRNLEQRKMESGTNSKIPQLSDLRESGAIEQDADMVCFLHRPEVYGILQDEDGDTKGIGYFIIAKHRNGPIGDVKIGFRGEFTKFYPLEEANMHYSSQINGHRSVATPMDTTSTPQMDDRHPYSHPFNYNHSGFDPESLDDDESDSFFS